MGRKINVKGSSGSGKSTLARELAARLELPYVELDALHHGPNWSEPTGAEFRARVRPHVERDGWVIDGNYESKLGDLVLGAADTVVWLDLPLRVKMARLWRRTSDRIRDEIELWNGNRETWTNAVWGRESLFLWALRSHLRQRRTFPARLPSDRLVRLRSAAAICGWLDAQDREPLERRSAEHEDG
jgi:adenylate kinase family enzyme